MLSAPPTTVRRLVCLFGLLWFGAAAALAGCQGPDPFYRHRRDAAAGDGSGDQADDGAPDRGSRGDRPNGLGGSGGQTPPADAAVEGGGVDVPGCASCKLVVLYACSGPDANQIRAAFKVANKTAETFQLSDIKFRYWYTDIGAVDQEFICDKAAVTRENITHEFVPVVPPRPGADLYAEIGFTREAGTLQPFSDTGEIQVRISRTDQQTITQTDDYSFDCSKSSFQEWNRITVYDMGVLVGGVEPPERPAPTGMATAGP